MSREEFIRLARALARQAPVEAPPTVAGLLEALAQQAEGEREAIPIPPEALRWLVINAPNLVRYAFGAETARLLGAEEDMSEDE